MGANVELDIFLKKEDVSLKQIFSLLEREGYSITLKNILIFDDWEYTNQANIDLQTLDLSASDILLKNFTLTDFIVNTRWRCVLITSFEDTHLNLSFGIDTDNLLPASKTSYDNQVTRLYDILTAKINKIVCEQPWETLFLAASMGVEYSVDFNKDITTMLANNSVARWLLPRDSREYLIPKKFTKIVKSTTIVLC